MSKQTGDKKLANNGNPDSSTTTGEKTRDNRSYVTMRAEQMDKQRVRTTQA